MMRRLLTLVVATGLFGLALLLTLGSVRYGGPQGLYRRVRVEFVRPQVVMAYVPTPMPTPTTSPVAQAEPPTGQDQAAPTATRQMTPTRQPTSTPEPTAIPAPTATPEPAHVPSAETVHLSGIRHTFQTWNNCGPATLAMYLSYHGDGSTQEQVRLVVRPNPEDKHAGVGELMAYAESRGFQTLWRVNGDEEQLRLYLSNGIPVMVQTWHEDTPGDGMGHYRLVGGFDDASQEWILYDSLGRRGVDRSLAHLGVRMPYDELYSLWRVFNRGYVLVYTEEQAEIVASILGDQLDDATMREDALGLARAEIDQNPEEPFAWFNLATNLTAIGRYDEAAEAYDRARMNGLPWRMLWYQHSPFQAYYEVGRYDEVIALANATMQRTRDIEELFYWRGRALQAQGDLTGARRDYQAALGLRGSFSEAAEALAGLDS